MPKYGARGARGVGVAQGRPEKHTLATRIEGSFLAGIGVVLRSKGARRFTVLRKRATHQLLVASRLLRPPKREIRWKVGWRDPISHEC